MKHLRKRIAVLGGTAAIAVGGLAALGPANAAAGGCVSRGEFHRVHRGMSQHHVAHIFGTNGKQEFRIGSSSTRKYNACTRFGFVTVDYKRHYVKHKSAFWG
jgi:hypothetical protein